MCLYIDVYVSVSASERVHAFTFLSLVPSFSLMEFFALLFTFNMMLLRFNRNTSNKDCKEHKEHVDDWAFFSDGHKK